MAVTTPKYTIAAMFRQSFDSVASYGFNKNVMYAQAGMDLDKLPYEYLLDPAEWSDKFWNVLTGYIPQDQIAFKIMDRFSMGVFGVAGYVIVNSPNFISAFQNFVRYTNLHTNSYNLSLEQGKDIRLYFQRTQPLKQSDRFNIELYVLGFTLNVLKLMPGRQFPTEVHYEFNRPLDMSCYNDLFGTNTQFFFNADKNMMVYDAKLAQIPLLNANEQLYKMFDKMAAESLQLISNKGVTSTAVKKELSNRIKGRLPTIEELALVMNISVRTLQQKLKNEHTTYRKIADEVRRDIATTHLKTGLLNISEIAYLLGFSEISAFSAAFKKWTGVPPTTFKV